MMGVCAPVQRRRRVWKHFVVANVVLCDLVHISRRRVSRDNRMAGSRKSLSSARTAMSRTSSPKRRPFGQPPGTVPY